MRIFGWSIILASLALLMASATASAQTKTISVTNPSGGDEITPGQTVSIQWSPNWVGLEYVDIELWMGGSFLQNIVIQHQTNGTNAYSHTFNLPSSSTTTYQVKVYEVASGTGGGGTIGGGLERTGVVGTSGSFYSLGSITVTGPTSSTSLRDSDTLPVRWNSDYSDPVKIELWKGSSKTHTATSSTSNDGVFNWTIPNNITSGTNYKIKVVDADDSGREPIDESSNFTLTKNNITVTGGENTSVVAGESHTVYWSHNLNSGYVNLYYEDDSGTWETIATNVSRSASSKTWTTPSGSNYIPFTRVRVRSTAYPHISDYASGITLDKANTITHPSSSSDIQEGQNINITWDSNYTGGNVKLLLFKGSGLITTITSSTANDGAFSWTLPESFTTGNDYRIRIEDTGGSPVNYGDYFTITANEVVAGSGGNTSVVAGEDHTFTWSHNLTSGYVDLHYENDSGGWDAIATDVSRLTTSKDWTTPSGSSYQPSTRIRIRSTDDWGAVDYIENVSLTKTITVSSPSSSVSSQEGENLAIGWDHNYSNGTSVKIDLYKGSSLERTIISSTPNDGDYNWNLPLDLAGGTDYRVRITDTGSSTNDYSSYFTIVANNVTAQTGGSMSVIAGHDHTFTWSHNLTSGNVDLDYENGSGGWDSIEDDVPLDSTSHTWTTPSEGNYQSSTRIRIRSTVDDSAVDYVDGITLTREITIASPTGSSEWRQGSTNPIWWSSNVDEPVLIELQKGGTPIDTIASSTPDDGVYNWTVPYNVQEGDDYSIRISVDGLVSETSPVFSIEYDRYTRHIHYTGYNAKGRLLSATLAGGEKVHYYYGSNAAPLTHSGAVNGFSDYYLTGIARVFDNGADSLTTSAGYDTHGRMSSLTSEQGVEASFTYDLHGHLSEIKNDSGKIVTAIRDTLEGSNFGPANPNHITTTSYRNASEWGQAIQYVDGLGRPIQVRQMGETDDIIQALTYDGQGRQDTVFKAYPVSGGLAYEPAFADSAVAYYDGMHNMSNSIPYSITLYEDNPLGRMVKTVPEGGEAESGAVKQSFRLETWNGDIWQVTTTSDETGRETETWTDGWGRTVRTVAAPGTPDSASTLFSYDLQDRLIQVTAPNGLTTTYTYNDHGQLSSKSSPDAGTVNYKYDAAGNLRFSQDANQTAAGEVAFTRYDDLGRPVATGVGIATFSSLNGRASYPFEDVDGNIKGMYAYENEPSTAGFPWNQFSTAMDSLTLNNTTGQLAARAWRADEGVSSLLTGNPWQLELMSYDREGRLARKHVYTGDQSDWAYHIDYDYNRQSELTERKLEVSGETLHHHYSYNRRGLLDSVWVSTGGTPTGDPEAIYTYTPSGAIAAIDYKGSKDVEYAYTIRGWVKKINNINSPNGNFAGLYEYADNGNVDSLEFYNPQISLAGLSNHYNQKFTYDLLNRLTGADYGAGATGTTSLFNLSGLTYDAAGNIQSLKRTDETGSVIDDLSYSYLSGTNQLGSLSDAVPPTPADSMDWDAESATFGYDGNGNLTAQSGEFNNISYDHRNLPIAFALTIDDTVVAAYNADGQRILKELKGGAWSFYVMDGMQTLGVIESGTLSHINLLAGGTFGRVDADSLGILAWGTRRYYITDHLGSTRAVVDDAGQILDTFDYYPFGLKMPGRTTDNSGTLERFTGKERDDEGGLNLDYFGARYYVPAIGRWSSVDPLADKYPEWSPYNYTLNNPLLFVDPNGEDVFVSFEDEDARSAFRAFLQTDYGRQFVASFARAGKLVDANNSDIVYAEFESDGSNSDHILSFREFDYYGDAAGKTSYDFYSNGEYVSSREVRNNFKELSKDSRLAVSISFNLAYKSEDIERYGSPALGLAETLSHESFFHAGVHAPDLITRLNVGDVKGVRTYLQDQYENNLRGRLDHQQVRDQTHPLLGRYIQTVKQLNKILTGN